MSYTLSYSIATKTFLPLIGFLVVTGLADPAKASVVFQPTSVFCDSSNPNITTGILPERDGVRGLKIFGTCEDPAVLAEQVVSVQGGSGGPDVFLSDSFFITWEFSVISSLNHDVNA